MNQPKSTINARVAAAVTRERDKAGLTIADLAVKAGMADRTLNRKLGGTSHWSTGELSALADALGVDFTTLLA